MALLNVTEDWREQNAGDNCVGGGIVAKRAFIAQGDGAGTTADLLKDALGAAGVTKGIPNLGTVHPSNSNIFCSDRYGDILGPQTIKVTCSYTTWRNNQSDSSSLDFTVNPLSMPPVESYGYEVTELLLDTDLDGNPIVNSADEPFDFEITRECHDLIWTIEFNRSSYWSDSWLYIGTVNSASWKGYDAATVKFTRADGVKMFTPDGAAYWRTVFEFKIRELGWQLQVTDKGYRTKDTVDTGDPQTYTDLNKAKPNYLNGSGQVLNKGVEVVKLDFNIYKETNFNDIWS